MSGGSIRRDETTRTWTFIVDVPNTAGGRKQLRRRGFATKRAAQDALHRVLNDVMSGSFIRPQKQPVEEYLTTWLEGLPASGRRPSTIAGYRHLVNRNVIPAIGSIDLQKLRAIDLDKLYAGLLNRGLSQSTVRKIHVIVAKAFSDAERKGITSRNVARLATPPSLSSARAPEMKSWTPEELRAFLGQIRNNRLHPLVRLAAMSGLRRGELCGLRWQDVDVANGSVAVLQAVTVVDGHPSVGDVKTKRSRRVVDLDPATVDDLRAWRAAQERERTLVGSAWTETGLVFTTPFGKGLHPDSLSQAFDRLVVPRRKMSETERSHLPRRLRFHDLRHTHASQLLAAGVNVKVVSERLGHASVAFTLDTYAHLMPGQQAQAAAAVAALVDNA